MTAAIDVNKPLGRTDGINLLALILSLVICRKGKKNRGISVGRIKTSLINRSYLAIYIVLIELGLVGHYIAGQFVAQPRQTHAKSNNRQIFMKSLINLSDLFLSTLPDRMSSVRPA